MSHVTYYDILTLSSNATPADIKLLYRKLSFIYHPDQGGSNEKMVLLNEAYQILSNPLLKREYDQKLAQTRQKNTITPPSRAHPRPQPATRASASPTKHQASTQQFTRAEKKQSHFWSWFVIVSVITVIFTGYEIYKVFQPSYSSRDTPYPPLSSNTEGSTTTATNRVNQQSQSTQEAVSSSTSSALSTDKPHVYYYHKAHHRVATNTTSP